MLLALLFAASAFAYSPHCEISGKAGGAATVEAWGQTTGVPAKITSAKPKKDGTYLLRFWQAKTESYTGFFVRAVDKKGVKLKESDVFEFSIDPNDCRKSLDL